MGSYTDSVFLLFYFKFMCYSVSPHLLKLLNVLLMFSFLCTDISLFQPLKSQVQQFVWVQTLCRFVSRAIYLCSGACGCRSVVRVYYRVSDMHLLNTFKLGAATTSAERAFQSRIVLGINENLWQFARENGTSYLSWWLVQRLELCGTRRVSWLWRTGWPFLILYRFARR